MEQKLDLQKLLFFTEGNTFTGSQTKDREKKKMLRYLVRPNLKEQQLEAFAWTEDLCFEAASQKEEKTASLNEEGLSTIESWLSEQYQKV